MAAFEEPTSTRWDPAVNALERNFHRLIRRASLEFVIVLGLPILVLLGSICALVFFTLRVNHSDQLLGLMTHAQGLVQTMVSETRGYKLTMQKDYLDNYNAARAELDPTLAELETLVSDNPGQKALVIQFRTRTDEWIKQVDESIGSFTGNKSASEDLSALKRHNLLDAAMDSADKFIDNETTTRERNYGWFGTSLVLSGIIFLLLAFTVIPIVLYRHPSALRHVGILYHTNLRQLAQEEWRSRNALALGAAGFWTYDLHNRLMTGDEMLSKIIGVSREDCEKGFPVARLVDAINKQDMTVLRADYSNAIRHNKIFNGEYRLTDVAGREYWVQSRGRIERDDQGKAISLFGFLIDITDRKKAEIAVIQSNERFRLFAATVDLMIWTADANGILDYVNDQTISFFGDRNIGLLWRQFVHPDDISRVDHAWAESVKTGEPYTVELRLRSSKGEYRWFISRARSLKDAQGNITKWFGAAGNIDELKKAQQSALDANRAKDFFLATLSHELRNPLNPALLVASSEAENPELAEPVRSNFNVILYNIEMEARLIDDLLDLMRISTGKMSLRMELVDVHNGFMDALASVGSDQLDKKIKLTVDWTAQKNEVVGDPLRLHQIFWNLLKNAVKFTPQEGDVHVNASNSDSQVVIKVSDSGIGIKPEELPRVFNPYAQGDHAGTTGSPIYGGLGLGLAIVKNLTDMHGGKIHAESEGVNKGSTFAIELPLAA